MRTHPRSFTISVVTFNNEETISGLLEDIAAAVEHCRTSNRALGVKFFDNGSDDGTMEKLRKFGHGATLAQSNRNIGFGAGHNRNLLGDQNEVFIVANPDVRFSVGIFDLIDEELDRDERFGVLLPRLSSIDGTDQRLCKRDPTLFDIFLRRFAPAPLQRRFQLRMRRFTMDECDYDREFDVEYGSGAFIIARRDVFLSIEGFDEHFFLYLEDADLTRSVRASGYRVVYCPRMRVTHGWNRGSYKSARLAFINVQSAIIYSTKWFLKQRIGLEMPRKTRHSAVATVTTGTA